MAIEIIKYAPAFVDQAMAIWNEVVYEGVAYPQEEYLTQNNADAFFSSQTYCALAIDTDTNKALGLYILHPNNVGRCGHIANASYAVASRARGRHIGEKLVLDSLEMTKQCGFMGLQFNAVVANNIHARNLYKRCGFSEIGSIPRGFRMKDGHYEDIYLYYHAV